MQSLKPSEGMFAMASKMFKDAWGQRAGQMEADKRLIRTERNKLDKQIEGLSGSCCGRGQPNPDHGLREAHRKDGA